MKKLSMDFNSFRTKKRCASVIPFKYRKNKTKPNNIEAPKTIDNFYINNKYQFANDYIN